MSTRDTFEGHERPVPALVIAFIVFHLLGLSGAILILLSSLLSSKSRTRQATWFNFIFMLVLFCFAYLLLFIAGQLGNPNPPFGICLAQACLIYGVPVFGMSATLALVYQMARNIKEVDSSEVDSPIKIHTRKSNLETVVAVVLPYILFAAIVVEVLVIGLRNPSDVQKLPELGYCNMKNVVPGRISAALVTLLIIPILILDGTMAVRVRENWVEFRSHKDTMFMFTRICIFNVFAVIAALVSMVFFLVVLTKHTRTGVEVLNLALSILPFATVVIFGTHPVLVRTLLFWRKRSAEENGDRKMRSTRMYLHTGQPLNSTIIIGPPAPMGFPDVKEDI